MLRRPTGATSASSSRRASSVCGGGQGTQARLPAIERVRVVRNGSENACVLIVMRLHGSDGILLRFAVPSLTPSPWPRPRTPACLACAAANSKQPAPSSGPSPPPSLYELGRTNKPVIVAAHSLTSWLAFPATRHPNLPACLQASPLFPSRSARLLAPRTSRPRPNEGGATTSLAATGARKRRHKRAGQRKRWSVRREGRAAGGPPAAWRPEDGRRTHSTTLVSLARARDGSVRWARAQTPPYRSSERASWCAAASSGRPQQ